MTQVWLYDESRIFTESVFVEKIGKNMTTTPLLVGYIKPTLSEIEGWFEGATPQEIAEWEEANKPKPIPPNKTEILEQEISRLEIEMLKMKKGMI